MGYGQPMSHPLAKATLAEVHEYPWPNPGYVDPYGIPAEAEKYKKQYAILGGDWSPFWHDAIDLLGMENLYLKMYDDPPVVDAVFQHIADFYATSNQRILNAASHAIDILFIGNDFGGQTGPLLGERLFRRYIMPHVRRLTDIGHAYGVKVMLHCCGGIAPLIPCLIEAGLDGVHAVQPSCTGMDLARLKADFGSKILLNGGIDSQRVLIEGNPSYVRARTREALKIMMPGGGYVAGASHDTILEETPVENVVAMFDAIQEFGRYR
jgi:uroporphyrinogen decarboxylase